MSLFYVNDHLITEDIIGQNTWPQNNEVYNRIMIKTTPMATRKNEETGKLENFTRPICAHNCSLVSASNTRISSVQSEGAKTPRVTVRTSTDTRYDSDIFIVALPYDGLIIPMSHHNTDALQIFKTLIIKSEQFSIEHMDKKYKRCIYFIARPNYNFMGHDGWYTDEANLEITFAQSNKSKDGQNVAEAVWKYTTVTIKFGENGQYDISSKEETAPYDTLNPDDLKGVPVCKLVKPTMLNADGSRKQK